MTAALFFLAGLVLGAGFGYYRGAADAHDLRDGRFPTWWNERTRAMARRRGLRLEDQ